MEILSQFYLAFHDVIPYLHPKKAVLVLMPEDRSRTESLDLLPFWRYIFKSILYPFWFLDSLLSFKMNVVGYCYSIIQFHLSILQKHFLNFFLHFFLLLFMILMIQLKWKQNPICLTNSIFCFLYLPIYLPISMLL